MEIPTEILYPVQAALEQWTDQREIHADDLEDVLVFILHLRTVLVKLGMTCQGFQCRQKNGQTLLTVKAHESDTPLVAFVTGPNPTGCMRRFLSLFEQDKLPWTRDRYPWI